TIPTPVITIPTITGPEFPVTQEVINDFQEAYPAVDVMAKLRALRMWSMTNPKRRKTYGGMMRWLNGRLAEVQDSGGGRVQARGTGAPNRQVQLEQSNRAAADAWLEQEEAGHG
ncbi:MAG: hypothetical protein ACREJT_11705, partial [Myxococcota bacterium]